MGCGKEERTASRQDKLLCSQVQPYWAGLGWAGFCHETWEGSKEECNKEVCIFFWEIGFYESSHTAGAQDMSCVPPEGSLKTPHVRPSDEAKVSYAHMNPLNICHILFLLFYLKKKNKNACWVNNSDKAISFSFKTEGEMERSLSPAC